MREVYAPTDSPSLNALDAQIEANGRRLKMVHARLKTLDAETKKLRDEKATLEAANVRLNADRNRMVNG